MTEVVQPGGTGGGEPGGNIDDVQLNDGAGGFAGSDNLKFSGGFLTINGDSSYGQLNLTDSANTTAYGGLGINGANDQIIVGALKGDLSIWNTQAINFSADAGSTDMMTIDSVGNVGINTNVPVSSLTVQSSATTDGGIVVYENGSTPNPIVQGFPSMIVAHQVQGNSANLIAYSNEVDGSVANYISGISNINFGLLYDFANLTNVIQGSAGFGPGMLVIYPKGYNQTATALFRVSQGTDILTISNINTYATPAMGIDINNNFVGINNIAPTNALSITGDVDVSGLTASRAVVTDGSKKLVSSGTTSTELGYVSGVTSAIQTQLNAKGTGTVTSVSGSGGTTGLTLTGGAITTSGTLTIGGTLAVANGGTGSSSALGIPIIVGNDRKTGLTAAQALATYTVGGSDASYHVSANILVTAATLHNFTATISYTDEGNTARVLTMNFSTIAGALTPTIANAGGAAPYEGVPLHIRAKAGTTIILATVGTFTTVTYSFEERIVQF